MQISNHPFLFLFMFSSIIYILYRRISPTPSPSKPVPCTPRNDRPIIAILSQPTHYRSPSGKKQSYIAASYVKFLESAGAQVIPLLFDDDENTIKTLLSQVNGLLFPGGDAEFFTHNSFGERSLTKFAKQGKFLTDLVRKTNENGVYFPLFGTCMGHELISLSISGDYYVLSDVNSTNHCNTLQFNENFNISQIFKEIPPELLDYVHENKGVYFNHEFAVEYETYREDRDLHEFFHITSYSHDKNNQSKFIATFEGKEMPVFSWQFHPEKAIFEWKMVDDINHSDEMVQFSQDVANFLVNEARKNNQSMSQEDFERLSIYNFNTTRKNDSSFEQIYLFDRK